MNLARKIVFPFLLLVGIWACDKAEEEITPEPPVVELSATPTILSFKAAGGDTLITISSNSIWNIYCSESWCRSSIQTSKGDAQVTITSDANPNEVERNANITISAIDAESVQISVMQAKHISEPVDSSKLAYIDPDPTGMASDAKILAANMHLGWNLGNTLEAIGGETAWGNPKATNDLIVAVKEAGFNAIRIPCAWDQYLENQSTYKIKDFWLQRVNEVVDYCVDNDMYTILNIHWDGGWMENNCTAYKQTEVNKKLAEIWKQIAIHFRDYDEHLLFAGANEPNADNQEQADVLSAYMQTFVDAVRSTGGRNAYRNIIVQAPFTDIDKADQYMVMPSDNIDNRLFAEVHYYTPWQFCGLDADAGWGKMYYFWGEPNHVDGAGDRNANWGEEDYMEAQFKKMKSKFIDRGIPVILGEFGAMKRDLSNYEEIWQEKHNDSRAYFNKNVAKRAKNNGLVPFFWDNGGGIFDRNTNSISDQKAYDGLISGANAGTYPF